MSGHRHLGLRYAFAVAILFSTLAAYAVTPPVTCSEPADPQSEPTEYFVSLADAQNHLAHVSIRLPQFSGMATLEMPVWNALYQVRNFAANVVEVRAAGSGRQLPNIRQTSTSEWDITGSAGCVVVSYDIHLDEPGPFGSELTSDYGFFNWAMVLMYVPELRSEPMSIRLLDVPAGWSMRDTHVFGGVPVRRVSGAVGIAPGYDALVDSPAMLGNLHTRSFQRDGATYYIVVYGDPAAYDNVALPNALQRVTHATVDWMQDRPYDEYTFLFDFPRGPGSGGMEHAYGAAISATAASGKVELASLTALSAHEFFHLWNVKRIRPQSLEPIDYQHQQDTRALWFSEGVTSTVSELMLARAGLIDERMYLSDLAAEISELESRPAHIWQSAESSSLDAWLEGNAFYRTAERSISYYNKGEVLGVLLDLRIRQLTQDRKSLRDLFHWMNEHYAKQHRYFPDSAGVQEAAEAVTGQSFADFFRDYVAGVKPIPYNDFFAFAGLRLVSETVSIADPGFSSTANLDGQSEITAVSPGSDAHREGLKIGDRILEVNGRPSTYYLDRELARMIPGQSLKLRVARAGKEHALKIKMGERQVQDFVLSDAANVTREQRARRTAWIHGDDEPGGAP